MARILVVDDQDTIRHFLSKANVVSGRRLESSKLSVLRLLASLQNPDASIDEIERLIARDVGLSYKLLRFINSTFAASPAVSRTTPLKR